MLKPDQLANQTAAQRDQFHALEFAMHGTPIPNLAALDLIQHPELLEEEISLASQAIEAAENPELGRSVPEIVDGANERLTKLVSLFEASRARGYGETDFAGHTVTQTNAGDHAVHIRHAGSGRRRTRASR